MKSVYHWITLPNLSVKWIMFVSLLNHSANQSIKQTINASLTEQIAVWYRRFTHLSLMSITQSLNQHMDVTTWSQYEVKLNQQMHSKPSEPSISSKYTITDRLIAWVDGILFVIDQSNIMYGWINRNKRLTTQSVCRYQSNQQSNTQI